MGRIILANSTALYLSSRTGLADDNYLSAQDGILVPVSNAGEGRLIYNDTTKRWESSEDGGPYGPVVPVPQPGIEKIVSGTLASGSRLEIALPAGSRIGRSAKYFRGWLLISTEVNGTVSYPQLFFNQDYTKTNYHALGAANDARIKAGGLSSTQRSSWIFDLYYEYTRGWIMAPGKLLAVTISPISLSAPADAQVIKDVAPGTEITHIALDNNGSAFDFIAAEMQLWGIV